VALFKPIRVYGVSRGQNLKLRKEKRSAAWRAAFIKLANHVYML
jgi:hypothetical protein